ncbi:MAG: HEXXH motif domain-containing protein [Pseudonocardiales bacterium]
MTERYRLPQDMLAALCEGGGSSADLALLRSGQLSKRMLQLRAIVDACERRAVEAGELARVEESYQSLAAVQQNQPQIVAELLASPQVGAWAAWCLRRLTSGRRDPGSRPELPPLWVDLAHLGAITAVAAIRSGVELRTSLVARAGSVMLPTLGRLTVESRAPWTLARFDLSSRFATVRVNGFQVIVPERGDAPGWEPVWRLQTRIDGAELVVELDDLDPHWRCFGLPLSRRLDPDTVERWRCRLVEAWTVLAARHPERLSAIGASVTCLVPLASRTRHSHVSATSRHAPGAVALTEPACGVGLAATLIHEAQHFKLNALHDLVPLYRPDAIGSFYSPWRRDPRPLAGLLHGIYAFVGIAEFLRRERECEYARLRDAQAELELARYSEQLRLGYQQMAAAQGLTELGVTLVARLGVAIERLHLDDIPADTRRLAEDLVVEDWAGWRLRYRAPEPAAMEKLADAWLCGHPATVNVQIHDRLIDSIDEGTESPRVRLARSWVSERETVRRVARNPEAFGARFPGVSEADVHLITGEYAAAIDAQSQRIAAGATDSMIWTGLVVAHRRICTDRNRSSLATRPELIRALCERLTALSSGCDPCELDRWLATAPTAYDADTSMSQSARRSRLT